jgi:integrase
MATETAELVKLYRRGRTWWADYAEDGRRMRQSLGTPFVADARLAAAKTEQRLRRKAIGIEDAQAEHAARPIDDHIVAFKVTMEARGVTKKHVKLTIKHLHDAVAAMTAKRVADLDLAAASRWLKEAQAEGKSARTVNARAQSLRAFGRWMAETRRAVHNPFLGLHRLNVAADRRRTRRALTIDETAKLLEAARRRPLADADRNGYDLKPATRTKLRTRGEHRALLYAVAVGTGVRRGELSRIRWSDLDLDSKEPTISISAASAKARRDQSVPLSATVLASLKDARNARKAEPDDARVFPRGTMPNAGTFRRDLKAAGIEAVADDTVIDFHALRVTLGTRLSDAGVPLVQAQRILRHSTPTLTANVYTRPASTDLRASLNRAAPATVTDLCQKPVTKGSKEASHGATRGQENRETESAESAENRAPGPQSRAGVSGAPERNRTSNLRIRNPLLCPVELPGRVDGDDTETCAFVLIAPSGNDSGEVLLAAEDATADVAVGPLSTP